MRYKITIEYDGTNFIGWQKQSYNSTSIQETIEKAIFDLTSVNIGLVVSGRTDTGVHALGQVAHFDLSDDIIAGRSAVQIMDGINHFLMKKNIAVINCQEIDEDFHSRFAAKMRHYQYRIINRRPHLTLHKNLAWHVKYDLNLNEMIKASKFLIGIHDFTSFRDASCQAKDAVRSIDKIEIFTEGEFVKMNFSGRSFLHHQVRNMVGTLVAVGKGRVKAEDVKIILEAKDRTKSGINAPSCGLYFVGVEY
ncbi:MAG: tRNA pseudouridine38-40 synthase [Rickettsiales bacterium]|jgi:tRNA pseudouridine38-40 synthase